MHTPSLRRRVIVSGVASVALLLLVLGLFVFLTLRNQLDDTLEEVLAARVALVNELAQSYDLDELPALLRAAGIPAVITSPDGAQETARPLSPRFGPGPPAIEDLPDPALTATLVLDDGAEVEVFASRTGVESTLRGLVLLSLLGSMLALIVSVWLFQRAAAYAVAPLRDVARAADRTAAGQTGERLAPDDPTTELGRFAIAYDRMLDSLEAAVADARTAEESTRRFVDDAAHQLRTPLATIRGSVEALLWEHDPRVRDRLLSNLVRETARSNRLLTSLLTLARLDQGRPPDLSPTDLAQLCRDELERTVSVAPHLALEVDADPASDGRWLLHDEGTREIVANLLDNARRHAESRIRIGRRLASGDEGGGPAGWLEVRVHDDGSGIPDGADDLVFERFATLDGQGGSGLGLPIARTLARAQGGDLTLDDGAFVLHLPATPAG